MVRDDEFQFAARHRHVTAIGDSVFHEANVWLTAPDSLRSL
jgi:hypothetical protein